MLLGILVSFHELGHFLAGRQAGVFVHEFAVGFGPVIFSRQKGETRYSLRLIPIGGYTRFAGEDRAAAEKDDEMKVPPERRLDNQSAAKRAWIVLAGPLANLLLAAVAFYAVFSFVGIMRPTTQIAEVLPGYPADMAGIRAGDQVIQVDDKAVESWQDLVVIVQGKAGVPTSVTFRRGEDIKVVSLTPVASGGVGLIGIRPGAVKVRSNPLRGLWDGILETIVVSVVWIQGIVGMILGRVPADVQGPLGITQILGEAARMGMAELLYLAGALSANLGLINLLPIPALDGSRLIFCAIEGIRGKPIDPEKEGFVHFIGFFVLVSLMIFVTYKDILRLIR